MNSTMTADLPTGERWKIEHHVAEAEADDGWAIHRRAGRSRFTCGCSYDTGMVSTDDMTRQADEHLRAEHPGWEVTRRFEEKLRG